MSDVEANRYLPLLSHHYLVLCQLDARIPKEPRHLTSRQRDINSLQQDTISKNFAQDVILHFEEASDSFTNRNTNTEKLNDYNNRLQQAFESACESQLSLLPLRPAKPWTSSTSLDFISQRARARQADDPTKEKELNKVIRRSIADDKVNYLKILAGSSTWHSIK